MAAWQGLHRFRPGIIQNHAIGDEFDDIDHHSGQQTTQITHGRLVWAIRILFGGPENRGAKNDGVFMALFLGGWQ